MKTRLERLEAALEVAIKELASIRSATLESGIATTLEQIQSLLSPTVEREEEVVRWECERCGSMYKEIPAQGVCCVCGTMDKYTKLTGTRKRTVRLVEKSVSAEVYIDSDGAPWVKVDGYRSGSVDIFNDATEAKRKNGTIIFIWYEEDK